MIIYCDDTNFYENGSSGNEVAGVGCLLLDKDNTAEIVSAALDRLRNDPDIFEEQSKFRDSRTLSRSYFHASEDSKNAHSWLCRSINELLHGEFNYGYVSSNHSKDIRADRFNLEYLGILASSSKEPVKIFIEQHSRLSLTKIEDVFRHVSTAIEYGAYFHYAIPKFFPKIDIEIVNKNNPGIQIVDFLLWANNRSRFNPADRTWLDRLNSPMKMDAGPASGEWKQGGMTFRSLVRTSWLGYYPQNAFPLPEFSGNEHVYSLFAGILQAVADLLNLNPYPENLPHLEIERVKLLKFLDKRNSRLDSEAIRQIASFYLRAFDMLPVFSEADKNDIEAMRTQLQRKRLAGLTLRKDLMHGVRTAMTLAEWFREALNVKPQQKD